MSAILGTQQYLCYFNQDPAGCKGPFPYVQGGITASMPGGSWLGALLSGFVSDRLGRKWAIMIGAIIWVIGSIIVCASQNIGGCPHDYVDDGSKATAPVRYTSTH